MEGPAGYSIFAGEFLNLFVPDHLVLRDEQGFPAQATERTIVHLQPYADLGALLEQLKR
jgi:hypothetical protein